MEAETTDVAADEARRLARNLRGVIGISFPIFVASLWSFYDDYWRFRHEFVAGNFVDSTGQARYEESAIWGALSVVSLAVCLWALWSLRREAQDPDRNGRTGD